MATNRMIQHALTAGALALGGIVMASTVWAVITSREREDATRALAGVLPARRGDDYVSSNTCRSCHPGEYQTWHRTFHRTMTQPATPETVAGEFDGTTVVSEGLAYRVYRKDDEFWAEMPDPEEMMYVVQGGKPTAVEDIPRVHRRVVMCTGSHHYQTYWVTGDPKYGRLLQTLPLIFLIKDKRWIPREEGFMRAPGTPRMITQWNHHCIKCHSTGGNPGLQATTKEGSFATSVGELGISCEACHGPAREHITANRNPLRRYRSHHAAASDSTIVNPEKLDHRRSSMVCGQCHGVFIQEEEIAMTYATAGVQYRPGEDIHSKRYYIFHPGEETSGARREDFEKNAAFFRERWWDDGTILAGGREYTAMADSACFKRGTMSCLSCHSMHGSDPVDQLRPEVSGNQAARACTTCHVESKYNEDIRAHTFHEPQSAGSDCLNCHMPRTSYALFGALRSHSIRSPNVGSSAKYGVPNACNLCHLDKTLGWTQDWLIARYGHEAVALTEEAREYSAALLWLLKGDAAQRVVTAWHLGWEEAKMASGSDWLAPFAAILLDDPYGVVRYVAKSSLHSLPGFEHFAYDFLGDTERRRVAAPEAIRHWGEHKPGEVSRSGREVLLDEKGSLLMSEVSRLLGERDDRPVNIKE